jgi:hypothetical protein
MLPAREGESVAAIDRTCDGCHQRYGWTGELRDCPPCPHCGHAPPDAEHMAQVEAQLDAVRAAVSKKVAEEWEARTPEQDAAYRRGAEAYAAYRAGGRRPGEFWIQGRRRAIDAAGIAQPLERWFNLGWQAAEFDAGRP